MGKSLDALEHILRAGGLEVGQQFFVDSQVRRQHEEVAALARHEQVADKRPQQSGLAHACSQGEADAGEVALEVLEVGVVQIAVGCADRFARCLNVGLFGRRDQINNVSEATQGFRLWLP